MGACRGTALMLSGVRQSGVTIMADAHRFDDLFREFGPVKLRRFFGGEGIYTGPLMIGMVFADTIYFKTDEETRKRFLAERTQPFSFRKHTSGETVVTTWYAVPDRLYDDPDEFAEWAREAHGVAAKPANPRTKGKAKPRPPRRSKRAP